MGNVTVTDERRRWVAGGRGVKEGDADGGGRRAGGAQAEAN